MGSDKELTNVSKATLERLPSYHRCLAEKQEAGEKTVSSTAIAEELHLSAVQVRKDLAAISSAAGKPKLGFEVDELLDDINRLLGYNNVTDAVLVGVGGLGSALAGYGGFKSYGLNIVAAFDTDPARIGKEVGGVRVYGADVLSQTVREKGAHRHHRRSQTGGAGGCRRAGRRRRARHLELCARASGAARGYSSQKRGHGGIACDPVASPR